MYIVPFWVVYYNPQYENSFITKKELDRSLQVWASKNCPPESVLCCAFGSWGSEIAKVGALSPASWYHILYYALYS